MKRFASSVASWICGLLLATISIPSALANADYTYKFTADPGQVTWYNDTTVEINESQLPPNDFPPPDLWFSLVSINVLADIDMGAWGGDPLYGFGPAPASLTPVSFSTASYLPGNLSPDCNISDANPSGWQGGFDGGWGGYTPFGCPALDYVISSSGIYLGINSGGDGQPFIINPASGTWALVPDAASSLELLAGAIIVLGTGRRLCCGYNNV